MSNKIVEDINGMLNNMQKTMESLIGEMNGALNQLPENERSKVVEHQSEINRIIQLAKSGDVTQLQKIVESHANTNNK